MGAIAGGIDLRGEGRVDRASIERVAAALRGADRRPPIVMHDADGGLVALPSGGAPGARLAEGRAPEEACRASKPDGSLHVVFDGMLLNREALRAELATKGIVPRSGSDAELLLHLYDQHRAGATEKLRGSFVLAAFEPRRSRLYVARDQLGTRNIRFYEQGDLIVFSTETRALVGHDAVASRFDVPALAHYLAFGYMPAPFTGVSFVSRIPPGHALVADRSGANLVRYYRPRIEPDEGLTAPLQAGLLEAELRRVMTTAFDAAPGAGLLLDGSLASAALAWGSVKLAERKPPVFEILPEGSPRQTPVESIAQHLGLEHHAIPIPRPTPSSLEAFAERLEEPIADPGGLAVFEGLKRIAGEAEHLLVPAGLDTLIGARRRYHRYVRETGPAFMPRDVFRTLARVWPRRFPGSHTLRLYAQRPSTRFLMRDVIFEEDEKASLLGGHGVAMLAGQPSLTLFRYWFRGTRDLDRPERYRLADMISRLPDSVLTRYDQGARAHGVDAFCPFLEADFVRSLGTLPTSAKSAARASDDLVWRLCAKDLPAGFRPTRGPQAIAWLGPDLKAFTRRTLADPAVLERGLLRQAGLAQILSERGVRGALRRHTLLMLELWRRSIEQPTPARVASI